MSENFDALEGLLDNFHVGQVWETSRGTLYRVVEVSKWKAVLRLGADGNGRKVVKDWDGIGSMTLAADHAVGHIHSKYAEFIKPENNT